MGFRSKPCVHGDVLHVLQPADDLHVFEAGHDGVRGLVDGLQARSAEAVDVAPPVALGRPAIKATRPGDIETLLALLLGVAQHDVFDLGRVDAAALDQGLDDGHGQIVAADVAEDTFFLMGPADRGSQAIDNHGTFGHGTNFLEMNFARQAAAVWMQAAVTLPSVWFSPGRKTSGLFGHFQQHRRRVRSGRPAIRTA